MRDECNASSEVLTAVQHTCGGSDLPFYGNSDEDQETVNGKYIIVSQTWCLIETALGDDDFEVDDLKHQVSFISWVRKFVPLVVDDPLLSTMPSEQISCLFIRLYNSGFV